MTRQAVVGRPLLLVAINAKAHRVIDHALRNRHLHQITVTSRTLHLRPDMRRVIESHVSLSDESVDTLPGKVFSTFRMIAQRLDSRITRVPNILMTAHADIDARNSRSRPLAHAGMAGITIDADIIGMDLMREIDRLLRLGLDVQEISGRISESRMRSSKYRRTPSLGDVWIGDPLRVSRNFRLLHATERDNRDGHP